MFPFHVTIFTAMTASRLTQAVARSLMGDEGNNGPPGLVRLRCLDVS